MCKDKRKLRDDIHILITKKEQTLQQSRDIEDRRSLCIDILDAVGSFLDSWSKLEDKSGLPFRFLRHTLANIVRELGAGNSQLRENLLDILQSTINCPECSQVILDFLPATVLPHTDQDEKQELTQILKQVFDSSAASVSPILDCLANLCSSGGVTQRDVVQFALEKLPKEHESRIHFLVNSLIGHIMNPKNARPVVEAIRAEMRSIEEETASAELIIPTCTLLVDLHKQRNSEMFFQIYLEILEDRTDKQKNTEEKLITIDMVVMLLTIDDSKHLGRIQRILDQALLYHHLELETISLLLGDELWQTVSMKLMNHLLSLTTNILLAPLRIRQISGIQKALGSINYFVLAVFHAFKDDCNAAGKLISLMLSLSNELRVEHGSAAITRPEKSLSSPVTIESHVKADVCQSVCTEIFEIFRVISKQKPHFFAPFKTILHYQLTSTSINCDATLRKLCALICNLEDAEMGNNGVFEITNSVLILRTLLFSSTVTHSDVKNDTKRCIHGLVFASEMLSSSSISDSSDNQIWNMVKSILLPPSSGIINPQVGLNCLPIVRIMFHRGSERYSRITPREVFQTMSNALSNSRLVQYVTDYSEREKKHVAQAYTERGPFFKSEATKKKKTRKMVFCFDSFIRDPSFVDPSSWKSVNQWVFELVDTYLSIGRKAELSSGKQWTPLPWLEAAIEFQLLDLSKVKTANKNHRRFFDCLHGEMSSNDVMSLDRLSSLAREKEISDLMKNLKNDRELEYIVRSLFLLALSLILSLAMVAAILNNSYEQYKDTLNDQEDEQVQEKTEILQYQLAKLYDLRRRCQLLDKALRTVLLMNRKPKNGLRGKRKHTKKNSSTFEQSSGIVLALEQLKIIVASYFDSSKFIRSEILWNIVVDSTRDATLIEVIGKEAMGIPVSPNSVDVIHIRRVVLIKLNALEQLSLQTVNLTNRNSAVKIQSEMDYLMALRPKLARCLRLCAYLSLRIPGLRNKSYDTGNTKDSKTRNESFTLLSVLNLSTLTAAYFRLLSRVLRLAIVIESDSEDQSIMNLADFINLFTSILGTKQPLDEAICFDQNDDPPSTRFLSLKKAFLSHLEICDDQSTAIELLETLAIFSIHLGHDAIVGMIEVSWKFLHYEYSNLEVNESLSPAYPFLFATQQSMSSAKYLVRQKGKLERSVQGTLVKAAFSKTKYGKNSSLVHGMLRHWGLLALSPKRSELFDVHLHKLLCNIQTFLEKVQEPAMINHTVHKEDEFSDEDDEYVPPNNHREPKDVVLPTSLVPGLDAASFSIYFDTLLQMTVAASSVWIIGEIDAQGCHPFNRFECLIEIFGSLVNLFQEKLYIFPNKALPSVAKASKNMINVTSHQLKRCIEWRNSQPVVLGHDIQDGSYDVASIRRLKSLLESVSVHIVGRLRSLCIAINSSKTANNHLESKQRLKALGKKVGVLKGELLRISVAHSISEPSSDLKAQNIDMKPSPRKRKRKRTISAFQEENLSLDAREASIDNKQNDETSSPQPISMELDGHSLSSEPSFDYSSSSNGLSNSFGASGHWGKDSEDDDESFPGIKQKSTWVQQS